ncbi:DUF4307 domain-containing protein [Streptomyces sp. GC420]|uniref:DUF4307 domain-containing protein n=1 Tax=Streptomyces sp. GC420 TaxID=2697568 RepID=UPI001414E6F4|nr:DUF4307 domain-containing protein [Streptomyces sp. GC420]NBM15046.1 DUF4307 domain-containing protein [Streptomyces sp. GC420]
MATARQVLPEGRYGRSADERADRKLKIIGSLLGVGLLALMGWFGLHYVGGSAISGELIKFDVVSGTEAQAHIEVRKDTGTDGVCTLRALDVDHKEVGLKEARFGAGESRIDEVVSVRTTGRATAVELVGCSADAG